MSTDLAEDRKIGASISVQIPGGEYITRQLREGDVVSIGSDDTSDLRLSGQGIAGTHCILTVEEGFCHLRDCYSPSGTFVDGEKTQQAELDRDCEIRVGESVVALSVKNPRKRPEPKPEPKQPEQESDSLLEDDDANEELQRLRAMTREFTLTETGTKLETTNDTSFEIENDILVEEVTDQRDSDVRESSSRTMELMIELEKVQKENEVLKERLEGRANMEVQFESDPFQQEMIDLLREEVESLQNQLSEVKAEGAVVSQLEQDLIDEALPNREEIERLVARLETLLEELTQKDEQVDLLQSLLHTAEDANQAETEEREQLASWLSEFEDRFKEKSLEWQSEAKFLKSKVQMLENERNQTLEAMQTDDTSVEVESLHRVIESIRQQLMQAQESVEGLQNQNETLKTELQEAQNSTSREEEIRLSRERAEIARMRHELEKKKLDFESTNKKQDADFGNISSAELKLREIRQELNESGTRVEDPNTSLSGRISSLWSRLNS